ncbi:MAG: hypothetical protein K6T27_09365 [Thermoleophilum sp.]|nr:hypothetical protein [Thermoleophilum sp.]
MPRVPVRIKLTKTQQKELLRRLLEREGKPTYRTLAKLTHVTEPATEVEVGRLWQRMPGAPEVLTPITLPIEEARALYAAHPEEYILRPPGPTAREVAVLPAQYPEAVAPSEWAKRVAYERVKEVPIKPSAHAESVVRRTLVGESREAEAMGLGIRLEDIRPGVKIETVISEKKGYLAEPELPPAQVLSAIAEKAAALWKFIGGGRSLAGKMFDEYRKASSWAKSNPYIKDARDYFTSCYTRYVKDPVKFERSWPREAKLIKEYERQYEEALAK